MKRWKENDVDWQSSLSGPASFKRGRHFVRRTLSVFRDFFSFFSTRADSTRHATSTRRTVASRRPYSAHSTATHPAATHTHETTRFFFFLFYSLFFSLYIYIYFFALLKKKKRGVVQSQGTTKRRGGAFNSHAQVHARQRAESIHKNVKNLSTTGRKGFLTIVGVLKCWPVFIRAVVASQEEVRGGWAGE